MATAELLSIDWWWNSVLNGNSLTEDIVTALYQEQPSMLSVTWQRTCNLSCSHCIYQDAHSSKSLSKSNRLAAVVESLASQFQMILHEGRIIEGWHLESMARLRSRYPALKLGLIDNGTYTRLLSLFQELDFKLDWLDISIDGIESSHNRQRRSNSAYVTALSGLGQAHKVVTADGRVSSLFTLTKINVDSVGETGLSILDSGLIDKWCVVPMTPTRSVDKFIEITATEVRSWWSQLKRVISKYGEEVIDVKVYHTPHLLLLAEVFGAKAVWDAFGDPEAVNMGRIKVRIDGVPVWYFPLSLWPNECVLVDSDAAYRTAHAMKYSLEELRGGKSKNGQDIRHLTVSYLEPGSLVSEWYPRCVEKWWTSMGQPEFQKEIATFKLLRKGG